MARPLYVGTYVAHDVAREKDNGSFYCNGVSVFPLQLYFNFKLNFETFRKYRSI